MCRKKASQESFALCVEVICDVLREYFHVYKVRKMCHSRCGYAFLRNDPSCKRRRKLEVSEVWKALKSTYDFVHFGVDRVRKVGISPNDETLK